MPELAKVSFVRIKSQELADELMKMEEKEVALGKSYKFGVMYAKAGQTEDEMFANGSCCCFSSLHPPSHPYPQLMHAWCRDYRKPTTGYGRVL
jgi:hypothetical protein